MSCRSLEENKISQILRYPFENCLPSFSDRNLGDFSLFNVDLKRPNCSSTIFTSAANAISMDVWFIRRKVRFDQGF